MLENLPVLKDEFNLGLAPEIKKYLVNWEDFISYWTNLSAVSNSVSWVKADLLLHLHEKLGGEALDKFATDINEPRSTVTNYMRTAKAFPPEKRIPHLSFTAHMVSSFADKFNDQTGEFEGESRYEWAQTAADEAMPTRKLQDEIRQEKEKLEQNVEQLPCTRCNKNTDEEVIRCVIYMFGNKNKAERFNLHISCFNDVVAFALGAKTAIALS